MAVAQNPDPYATTELPSVALDLDCKKYEHGVPNSGNVPKLGAPGKAFLKP